MKKQETTPPVQPDLKHDNMEYAADSGEVLEPIVDDLSFDDNNEEITAEELDALENDDTDSEGMALITAETDSTSDEDNYLTTPDDATEEDYETDDTAEPENERQ